MDKFIKNNDCNTYPDKLQFISAATLFQRKFSTEIVLKGFIQLCSFLTLRNSEAYQRFRFHCSSRLRDL